MCPTLPARAKPAPKRTTSSPAWSKTRGLRQNRPKGPECRSEDTKDTRSAGLGRGQQFIVAAMSSHIDWVRAFCLSLPHVTEDIQWEDNLLFRIAKKMFCVVSLRPAARV